jgi:hypothetical protein
MMGKHFAMIPVEVLTSEAYRTLPNWAVPVLVAFAAQYRGNNNGDLALSWSMARLFGIDSKWQLTASIAMLLERGLIQKTRQGGKKPLGPCLYALTWQPINDLKGKIESGETFLATNAWAKWTSKSQSPASAINQQHLIRGASAPAGVPLNPVSAPNPGSRTPSNGTCAGPPSISRWGVPHLAGAARERSDECVDGAVAMDTWASEL